MKSTGNVTNQQKIRPDHSVGIKVNKDLCNACGTCLKVCPYDAENKG